LVVFLQLLEQPDNGEFPQHIPFKIQYLDIGGLILQEIHQMLDATIIDPVFGKI